jgi:GntR family transcriptional repressor for pyruvate dehydrogenase complex
VKSPAIVPDTPFQPPQRAVRLADQLYEQIVGQIVDGRLPIGERLPSENRLSTLFGVSRPVVRETIFRLQADGLVVTRHGAGSTVVKQPRAEFLRLAPIGSVADLMRCYEYRIALEGEAAGLAAQRITPDSRADIEAALAELDQVIERREIGASADHRFHVAVARASQNELFVQSLDLLSTRIFAAMHVARSMSLGHSPDRLALVQNEHQAIFRAIARGDAEAARTEMRHHIDNARSRVLEDARASPALLPSVPAG